MSWLLVCKHCFSVKLHLTFFPCFGKESPIEFRFPNVRDILAFTQFHCSNLVLTILQFLRLFLHATYIKCVIVWNVPGIQKSQTGLAVVASEAGLKAKS